MNKEPRPVCLIGQAFVDVTLPQAGDPYKMRLGGILHAARALWGIGVPYVLAYAAPMYLTQQVEAYALAHGAVAAACVGEVDGSPNVMIIGEVKEAGNQGYEYLLRDEHRCRFDLVGWQRLLRDHTPSDVLVISGGFDLVAVLSASGPDTRVYVDLTGACGDWDALLTLRQPLAGLTLSTSSALFKERFRGAPSTYWVEAVPHVTQAALLKENRGGARLLRSGMKEPVSSPAFLSSTSHSVGVGDCYDAVWVAQRRDMPDEEALAYASLVAGDYAATTYPDEFRIAASASAQLAPEEVTEAAGVRLPWEVRPELPIYLAAPDFDFADRRPIDAAVSALKYHNFVPRLPVRENGQMGVGATAARRADLLAADLALLDQCRLMVAVLTYNDPGTLIEIGLACERGMPVIVFDPGGKAENLMLTGLPALVTGDLERVVSEVYRQAARLRGVTA